MSSQDPLTPPQVRVFWIIWFAIFQGLIIIQFVVGGGITKGADQGSPPAWILIVAGALALAALAIRFRVIPQISAVPQKLPAMIIGLALSEGVGLLGIFAVGKEFPATRLVMFCMAIGCIICFTPIYTKSRVIDARFH